jgi:hypothetical protein
VRIIGLWNLTLHVGGLPADLISLVQKEMDRKVEC